MVPFVPTPFLEAAKFWTEQMFDKIHDIASRDAYVRAVKHFKRAAKHRIESSDGTKREELQRYLQTFANFQAKAEALAF